MRPRYERASDTANEERVARELEQLWNCEAKKLSETKYRLDRAFFRDGKMIGWGEIKCRPIGLQTYQSIILSARKVSDAHMLHLSSGLPCSFIVEFMNDGILGRVDLIVQRPTGWGGRTDRGDTQDQEPVVHIPVSEFKIIRPK